MMGHEDKDFTVAFGRIYASNVALIHVVECYRGIEADYLLTINVFKNLVAFLYVYTAMNWVSVKG